MIADLRRLLSKRYPVGEWALFFEVPNATGHVKSRTADAIAMNMWHSRGLELHGFEMKVSRGDWLRELKKPMKAEALWGYCDHWWVVAKKDVVKPSELPVSWGLLEPRGTSSLVVVSEAPRNTRPTPVDRFFMAAMLRAAYKEREKRVDPAAVEAMAQQIVERQRSIWEHEAHDGFPAIREQHRALLEDRQAFEKASGVSFSSIKRYAAQLGGMISVLQEKQSHQWRLQRVLDDAERFKATADLLFAAAEKIRGEGSPQSEQA